MHENKTFYSFIFLTETRYFNTGFVSLQYKNTNQYWSKCNKIFAENHKFFKKIFFLKIFFDWAQLNLCGWTGPNHLVTGRSQWPNQAMHT
jgi:hypothetical protein